MTAASSREPGWKLLCDTVDYTITRPGCEFEELEDRFGAFAREEPLLTTLAEVETIKSMKFIPVAIVIAVEKFGRVRLFGES